MMTAVMGIAMRAVFSGLLCAGLASCTATSGLPHEFAAELARGEPGTGRIEVRDGEIGIVSAPVAAADLPEPVVIAVEAIQPGGTTLEISRVWRGGVVSFSVVKLYGEGEAAQRRRAWLTANGEVIERAHQIPTAEVAEAAREAAAAVGEIEIAEVVQTEPGVEHYRFWLRGDSGAQFVAECSLRGTDLRVARRLTAEVRAWR